MQSEKFYNSLFKPLLLSAAYLFIIGFLFSNCKQTNQVAANNVTEISSYWKLNDSSQDTLLAIEMLDSIRIILDTLKSMDSTNCKQALPLSNLAINIFKKYEVKNPSALAETNLYLGSCQLELAILEKAKIHLETAVSIKNNSDDTLDFAMVQLYRNLGKLQYYEGNYYQAINFLEKGMDLLGKLVKAPNEMNLLLEMNLAEVYAALNDTNKRLNALQKAEKIYKELAVTKTHTQGQLFHNLGETHAYLEQYDTALLYLTDAYQIYLKDSVNYKTEFPFVLSNLGRLYANQNEFDTAFYYINRAVQFCKQHLPVNHYARANALSSMSQY